MREALPLTANEVPSTCCAAEVSRAPVSDGFGERNGLPASWKAKAIPARPF